MLVKYGQLMDDYVYMESLRKAEHHKMFNFFFRYKILIRDYSGNLLEIHKKNYVRKKINVVSIGNNDSLPFEHDHVCDIVAFTQDISKDTCRIAPSYLTG